MICHPDTHQRVSNSNENTNSTPEILRVNKVARKNGQLFRDERKMVVSLCASESDDQDEMSRHKNLPKIKQENNSSVTLIEFSIIQITG